MREVAERLLSLYFNRLDCYGVSDGERILTVKGSVTVELVEKHLRGEFELGAHAIEPTRSTCRWVAWDIDDRKTRITLYDRLGRVFPRESVVVERTSGRGYHILLFFLSPIPSEICYSIALKFAEGLKGVETYPKQPWIEPEGYGNWIRLALGYRKTTKRWSRLLSPEKILDVKPILPGEYVNLSEYKQPIPFWLKANRCIHRTQDQSGAWNCLKSDGSVGLCSTFTCPEGSDGS